VEAKIDLNRVTTFVRVIQSGSFTLAARQLGLPVSSVSRSVARLEEEIGVRLVHRTTRRLALSEAGQQYYQRMQTVVAEAEAATSAVAGLAQTPTGLVRVTAPDSRLLGLAPLLASIVAQHPGLRIDLTLTARRVDLIEEGIDLAIRGGKLDDSSLVAHRIGPNEFGVVASPTYLARRGTPRTLAELKQHDCIRLRMRSGLLPWRFGGSSRPKEVAVTGSLISDDLGFVYEAALHGAGLAYLPVEALGDDFESQRLVRVLPRQHRLTSALSVVWPSQRLLPARVVLVRDLLVAGLSRLFRR
jgi:DNA-binding transcriptional LysR family regulator